MRISDWSSDVCSSDLRNAVAVGVEQRADMGEAVPLRGVLQTQQHRIVADHIGQLRVFPGERQIEVRQAVALGREVPRREAPRAQVATARQVERQGQAEPEALADPRELGTASGWGRGCKYGVS